jgi:hypothetical protein
MSPAGSPAPVHLPCADPQSLSGRRLALPGLQGDTSGKMDMTVRHLSILLGIVAVALSIIPGRTLADSDIADTRCQGLVGVDFSNIVHAPTQINAAKLVKNVGELFDATEGAAPPELVAKVNKTLGSIQPFCHVSGYVTPNVGFDLLLPTARWNGNFLHVGCGGWCGSTTFAAISCALHGDYACIGTDMGHTGAGGLWLRNNLQAEIDFSYRATHVASLAGKAIVEQFYAKSPNKSYFMGCSTGGYQAMVEAQRFPWDFDGIIAGAPDMDESDLAVRGIWLKRNFIGKDGQPVLDSAAIQLVHRAALAKCDMDDGVKDGIVGDPTHCKFDPAVLLCKAGKESGCLIPLQVQAVKNIYGVPVTSKGEPISTRGVFPGSELNWVENFSRVWGEEFFKDTALLSILGKEWIYTDFDFDRDYKRSGAGVIFADTNPDLRKFKAAGGKLLSYQGGNDTLEIPGAIFDYYETVEKTMGGRAATQDFFRLFTVPGMNHCTGGDGVFAFDYLRYLEAWVEQGRAPDVMIGAHVSGLQKYEDMMLKYPLDPSTPIAFTRPVYPYPLHAKYKGTGDPNNAANFGAVE